MPVAWYLVWFANASFGQQPAEWGPYRGANVNSLLTERDVKDFAALGGNLLRANFAFRPLMRKTPTYGMPRSPIATERAASAKPTTLDVAYHQRGTWGELPAGDVWEPPDKPGYRHFSDARARSTDEAMRLSIVHEAAPEAAILPAGGSPTTVITATGIGRGLGDPVPVVIFRRDGRESRLVWALSLDGRLEGVSGQWTGAHVIVNLTPARGAPSELRWDLARRLGRASRQLKESAVTPRRRQNEIAVGTTKSRT